MSTTLERATIEFQRQRLGALYAELRAPQQELFNRLFPGGVENMDAARIPGAYDLCERTIKKNATR